MKQFKIFGIDLQDEFTTAGHKLCVPGAPGDIGRMRTLIENYMASIVDFVLTIDTHPEDHIGHPGWWKLRNGGTPAEFTLVTEEMVLNGDIRPADPQQLDYAKEYLHHLKAVMIWNRHCGIKQDGHAINETIAGLIRTWGGVPTIVKKGFNRDTEAFGVFAAEHYNHEIGTDFNWHLLADIINGGYPVVVVGEARSHCVRRSLEQMVEALGDGHLFPLKKIVIVKDCMSDVPGFERDGEDFIKAMEGKVTVCNAADLEAALEAL